MDRVLLVCGLAGVLWCGCASAPTPEASFPTVTYSATDYVVRENPPPKRCDGTAPRTWAVIVGVNHYQDSRISPLKGAVKDAWNFYHYLSSPKGGKIPTHRLKLLLNHEATRKNVDEALGGKDSFLRQACSQDLIVVYFAGHGEVEEAEGRGEDAFLLVHDSNLDKLVSTGVSMQNLYGFLEWRSGQGQGNLLMLIDACHSGNIKFPGKRGTKPSKRISLFTSNLEKDLTEDAGVQGWGAISASASDQFSQEAKVKWEKCVFSGFAPYPYEGGLFTCHLLKGLVGGHKRELTEKEKEEGFGEEETYFPADVDKNAQITLDELTTYLKRRVVKDSNGNQVPQVSGTIQPNAVLVPSTPTEEIPIPKVPEKYLMEEQGPGPLVPWLWAGGGLTVLAAGAGALFYVRERDVTEQMNDGLRDADYEEASQERDNAILGKNASIGAAFVLGGLTATGVILDLLDQPEDIDDVYTQPPKFEINIDPMGGASVGVGFTWE